MHLQNCDISNLWSYQSLQQQNCNWTKPQNSKIVENKIVKLPNQEKTIFCHRIILKLQCSEMAKQWNNKNIKMLNCKITK